MSHLYIHIPFCHRVCPYCAFYKHTPGATDMRAFAASIVREAELRLPLGFAPSTIYFGGGTPSMLSPTRLEDIVRGLERHIDTSRVQEWSFEANPATFTAPKVEHWRSLGINRISLGAQSFEPELLRLLGREHTPEQIAQSMQLLRSVGMPQVNIDLMFCLPGQTVDMWQHTLYEALKLRPDHLSTYSLTLEEGTPFLLTHTPPTEETEAELFSLTHDVLTAAGFRHYEVSNYARDDASRSWHNLAYWRGEDYYGLGPGACGTVGESRYTNTPDTTAYIAALSADHLPPGEQEKLSTLDRAVEQIGLRLRTDEGLPLSSIAPEHISILRDLVAADLARIDAHDSLILTPAGLLLADEIAVQLMP